MVEKNVEVIGQPRMTLWYGQRKVVRGRAASASKSVHIHRLGEEYQNRLTNWLYRLFIASTVTEG